MKSHTLLWLAINFMALVPTAWAIDCSSSKSLSEIAICANPAALAADRALERNYIDLRKKLSNPEKIALNQLQLAWLQDRDLSCSAPLAPQTLSECLTLQTTARLRLLQGKPDAGPGTNPLPTPLFIFKPSAKHQAKAFIEGLRFAETNKPGETAFNNEVDRILRQTVNDSDVQNNDANHFFVALHTDLTYASPLFISARLSYENYLGQARPFRFQSNVNVDLTRGRLLTLADILDEPAAQSIYQFCKTYVSEEKKQRNELTGEVSIDGSVALKEIAEYTAKLSAWSFGEKAVTVSYPDEAFGGYGACGCECKIPYSVLRPLKNKNAPLP